MRNYYHENRYVHLRINILPQFYLSEQDHDFLLVFLNVHKESMNHFLSRCKDPEYQFS